jgi:DNA-directed RNA polymerase beta' subunit
LLGLTGKEFEATIAGQHKIGGKTGPEALATALASINVEKEIENCRRDIAGTRKGARDLAIRKLAYLKACEKTGVHPKDWILSRVPVLPTKFRAVSKLPGGSQLVADPNYLYKELFDANKSLAELSGQVDDVSEERLGVYRAFKGVVGLGDPTRPKNIERRVRGLLAHVFGDGPKYSMVQQKLLGKTTDLVGRAVIVPNPDLSMDEIGIPEKRAWEVYAPAIVRRLVQNGMKRTSALMAVHDRTQTAAKAMLAEMDARPVIANRAPVLHRFGQLAFFPRLVKGDTLQVSPLIVGGFGADFDGNCVDFNTEVVFHLQPNTIKKAPAEFRTKLEAVIVRLTGKTLVSWFAENREITMKIGDFPRMGEPQITSTGQAVYDVPPGISVLSYAPGQGVMLKPVRRTREPCQR